MVGLLRAHRSQNEMQAEMRSQAAHVLWPGLTAIGVFLIGATEALRWPWQVHLFSLALIFLSALVRILLPYAYSGAVWLLVLGSMAVDLLSFAWAPSAAALYVLALPASAAALLLGWSSGLAVAALSTLITLNLAGSLAASPGQVSVPALLVIWGTTGVACVSSYLSSQTNESLWVSYCRMQKLLEEARDQRLELKQVQEDLVQANTELARLSDRLSLMYQVAEEARRAKEEFVANVSHELRTPLNMITGFSEMISEAPDAYGVELPPALLADVEVILRNSRHLASLVDDVLDLSQVEAGQMALSKEWVSLREIVDGALVAVRPLFEAKGLALELEMPDSIPPLYCDRTRIRQVLLNLVSNAGRFTERGGVRVRVRTEGNYVVVSVTDSGPGIPPEHQQRIFTPFHQIDGSIRRRFGGTGLGLSISKRFVEMHDGRMWLESEPGKGSTFYFSLPIQDGQPPATETAWRWLSAYHQENPRTRPSKAPAPKPAPRFVVLEPGNVLQRLLSRYLEGSEVVSVRSYDEAVAELNRSPAQVLVVNDPVVQQSVPALVQQAAALPYGTPTIACWVPGEKEAASRLGVVRYLLKPVSRDALCSAIAALGDHIESVLLVDDDPEVLQLFGRMLTSGERKYRVLRAARGQRALDLLRERKPDVLLLDLVMPGMDGYQVLREKSQDPEIRDIPVIAVSAVDPVRESIISSSLTLMRGGGLTLRDLLTCLRMWSEAMVPPKAANGPGRPESLGG